MNKRDKMLRKTRGSKCKTYRTVYKRQKSKFTNLIRKAKSTHYRNILNENETVNPKKFWKTIKSIFPTKFKHTASGTIPVTDRVREDCCWPNRTYYQICHSPPAQYHQYGSQQRSIPYSNAEIPTLSKTIDRSQSYRHYQNYLKKLFTTNYTLSWKATSC